MTETIFAGIVVKTGNNSSVRISFYHKLLWYVSVSYYWLLLACIVPMPFGFYCIRCVSLQCEPLESITVHAEH